MKRRFYTLLLILIFGITCIVEPVYGATNSNEEAVGTAEGISTENIIENDSSNGNWNDSARQAEEARSPDTSTDSDNKDLQDKSGQNILLNSAGYSSSWYISSNEMYLNYDPDDYEPWILWVSGTEVDKVTSSNKNVVEVGNVEYYGYEYDDYFNRYVDQYRIKLYRNGGGTATVKVWSYDGTYRTCKIKSQATTYKMPKSVSFSKKKPWSDYYISNYYWGKDREIVKAVSSKSKVASVKVQNGVAIVTPKKTGKTKVTVTDRSGKKTVVSVSVSKSWKKANLKWCSSASIQYEDKYAYIYSKPGAKVKLKIGKKTYKKKIGKSGSIKINIKKNYKLNTKFSVTYTYKGTKATIKGKVNSYTFAGLDGTIYSCRSYVPVVVYHAKKGDMLYVTFNGKTYKRKISYSGTFRTTIWTDGSIGCIPYIKFTVKNKYKQILDSYTRYLTWS